MQEGMLTINLDPPCLGFTGESICATRPCSTEDVYLMLHQLGVEKHQLRDCLIRIKGRFPDEQLAQFGLAPQVMPLRSAWRRHAV